MTPARCRFCDDLAVAVFDLPRGCACFPDDRVQALCMQHIVKANDLAGMSLKVDLTVDGAFTRWWAIDLRPDNLSREMQAKARRYVADLAQEQ